MPRIRDTKRAFDPSHDVDEYPDELLRQYGINANGSLSFYRNLASLVPRGDSVIRFRNWCELSDAVIALQKDDRGLRYKARIDAKLLQLRKHGLLDFSVNQDGAIDSYVLTFLPPEEWRTRAIQDKNVIVFSGRSPERSG